MYIEIHGPTYILACNCNLAGVLDNGQCTPHTTQNTTVGQCFCKPRVVGQACDQCISGFFNLTAENPDGCQGIKL